MFDYNQAVKDLFESYYKNLDDDIILTLIHDYKVNTIMYPISCLPLTVFDDYYTSRTVSYIPVDKVDESNLFEVHNLITQKDSDVFDEKYKSYLITIDKLRQLSPAYNTLFSLVKFKE